MTSIGVDAPYLQGDYGHDLASDRLGYAAAFLWQLGGDLVEAQRGRRPFTELASTLRHHLRARRR